MIKSCDCTKNFTALDEKARGVCVRGSGSQPRGEEKEIWTIQKNIQEGLPEIAPIAPFPPVGSYHPHTMNNEQDAKDTWK
jgi:hypothetical protein